MCGVFNRQVHQMRISITFGHMFLGIKFSYRIVTRKLKNLFEMFMVFRRWDIPLPNSASNSLPFYLSTDTWTIGDMWFAKPCMLHFWESVANYRSRNVATSLSSATWSQVHLKSSPTRLYVQCFVLINIQIIIKVSYYWPFVMGNHRRWTVDHLKCCHLWERVSISWVQNQIPVLIDHYNDVVVSAMASQITSLTIIYSTVLSGADQWKHQSSASLALARGIHRWITRKRGQ